MGGWGGGGCLRELIATFRVMILNDSFGGVASIFFLVLGFAGRYGA